MILAPSVAQESSTLEPNSTFDPLSTDAVGAATVAVADSPILWKLMVKYFALSNTYAPNFTGVASELHPI